MKKLIAGLLLGMTILTAACAGGPAAEQKAESSSTAVIDEASAVQSGEAEASEAEAVRTEAKNASLSGALGGKTPPDKEVLAEAMRGCIGYAGSAGSSLKGAIAAYDILSFCQEKALRETNPSQLLMNLTDAYWTLNEEERTELEANLDSIHDLIEDCYENYSQVEGLFEDAGVSEMKNLAADKNAQADWKAFEEAFDQIED